ncbi:sigma-70 family RNA polymerase sigma factor [Roseibium denhamense]|nr:sigma-70 family RNA polymerase sigma factor [Roseibium denhamense]
MGTSSQTAAFESMRARLTGLAYRMLGSMADAEDAVQDTYLRWQGADAAAIQNPEAWLTTVCTNRCLDLLKSAHKKRVDYVGSWIPEPLQTTVSGDAENGLQLSQSLTTAFLLLMERLSPKERAAYLLHEIFGHPFSDVADALDVSEAAARQLSSRARQHVTMDRQRFLPPAETQDEFLSAFLDALTTGSTDHLAGLLAETVRFRSDGGGKTTALRRILQGSDQVNKYISRILRRLWTEGEAVKMQVNGVAGLALIHDGKVVTAMVPGYAADGTVEDVFMIRNPEKLRYLLEPLCHDPESGGLIRLC